MSVDCLILAAAIILGSELSADSLTGKLQVCKWSSKQTIGKKLAHAGKIYGKCFQVRVNMILFQLAVLIQFYLSSSPLKKKPSLAQSTLKTLSPPGLPPALPSARSPGGGKPSRLGLRCFALACVIRRMLLQVHQSNVTKPTLLSIYSYHIALLCKILNVDFFVLPQNSIFVLIIVATWIL